MSDNRKRVIVALDNMDKKEVDTFLNEYSSEISLVKIGMELFYRYGREYILAIAQKYKVEIFLDLKLHDIPSTVYKSIRSLEGLPIKFLTIHLSGGNSMVREALRARDNYIKNCKILGVSVLTSLDQSDCNDIWANSSEEVFKNLYKIALNTHIDGIVSSAHELEVAQHLDKNDKNTPLKVCPGIKFATTNDNDQQRVMTPSQAFDQGADYLVIGRAITQDPQVLTKPELFV